MPKHLTRIELVTAFPATDSLAPGYPVALDGVLYLLGDDGVTWERATGDSFEAQATEPDPAEVTVWLDTSENPPAWKIYQNGAWELIAGAGGGGDVVELEHSADAPTDTPTDGGVLYAQNGALFYRGSAGTVTQIAEA